MLTPRALECYKKNTKEKLCEMWLRQMGSAMNSELMV